VGWTQTRAEGVKSVRARLGVPGNGVNAPGPSRDVAFRHAGSPPPQSLSGAGQPARLCSPPSRRAAVSANGLRPAGGGLVAPAGAGSAQLSSPPPAAGPGQFFPAADLRRAIGLSCPYRGESQHSGFCRALTLLRGRSGRPRSWTRMGSAQWIYAPIFEPFSGWDPQRLCLRSSVQNRRRCEIFYNESIRLTSHWVRRCMPTGFFTLRVASSSILYIF
jgi:hypothetical protein